jgi:hypothetical protein
LYRLNAVRFFAHDHVTFNEPLWFSTIPH